LRATPELTIEQAKVLPFCRGFTLALGLDVGCARWSDLNGPTCLPIGRLEPFISLQAQVNIPCRANLSSKFSASRGVGIF